jgi:hypothetical protein
LRLLVSDLLFSFGEFRLGFISRLAQSLDLALARFTLSSNFLVCISPGLLKLSGEFCT